MIDYSEVYLKVKGRPEVWIVEDGVKRVLADMGEMYRIGLRNIVKVDQAEFDAIPYSLSDLAEISVKAKSPNGRASLAKKTLYEKLSGYRAVAVVGPHRSGTAIGAKIVADETSLKFVVEPSSINGFVRTISTDNVVVQAPSFLYSAVDFIEDPTFAIVLMARSLEDINASQKRVGWGPIGEFADRYNAERAQYESLSLSLAEAKYDFWESIKDHEDAYVLKYESLADHRLWIAPEDRADMEPWSTTK